jgi:hypothetical protein
MPRDLRHRRSQPPPIFRLNLLPGAAPLDKGVFARQSGEMPKSRPPGLPTISALMLTATIVAIVSITGAPKIPYDILRDFQPTMAALVALGAATFAYFAAMAKVTLDREIAARQRAKERIGLYLRLISQLRRLQQDAYYIGDYLGERVMRAKKDNTSRVEWIPEILALSGDFEEVEKAWQNIELLPAVVFNDLDYLRQVLATIKAVGKHNEHISEVEYVEARAYVLKCNRLVERCSPIIDAIEGALKRIKPLD